METYNKTADNKLREKITIPEREVIVDYDLETLKDEEIGLLEDIARKQAELNKTRAKIAKCTELGVVAKAELLEEEIIKE